MVYYLLIHMEHAQEIKSNQTTEHISKVWFSTNWAIESLPSIYLFYFIKKICGIWIWHELVNKNLESSTLIRCVLLGLGIFFCHENTDLVDIVFAEFIWKWFQVSTVIYWILGIYRHYRLFFYTMRFFILFILFSCSSVI